LGKVLLYPLKKEVQSTHYLWFKKIAEYMLPGRIHFSRKMPE